MPKVSELMSRNIGNTITNVHTWGGIIYNVKEYGAKGDGKTDDSVAILKAINAANENNGTVVFPPGDYIIGGNVTFPENVALWVLNGAILSPNNGISLAINGPLEAGLYQIFSGDGIVFGSYRIEKVYPQWFGAHSNNSNDDTMAIQKAISFITRTGTGSTTLFFFNGTYKVTDTINITSHKIKIEGENAQTFISFSPNDVTKDCFLGNGEGFVATMNAVVIKNLNFVTDKPLTAGAMIHLRRTSQCVIEGCSFHGTGGFDAIWIEQSIQTEIRNNFIEDYTSVGIRVNSTDVNNQSIDTTIRNNYIRDCQEGIRIQEYCNGVYIRENILFENSNNIHVTCSARDNLFSVKIQENDIDSALNQGLVMTRVKNFQINDNWFSNNTNYSTNIDNCGSGIISGNLMYPKATGNQTNYGVFLKGCDLITISGNTIGGGDGGMRIDRTTLSANTACTGITTTGNTIHDTSIGIHLYNNNPVSNGVTIVGNTFKGVTTPIGNGGTTNLVNQSNNTF